MEINLGTLAAAVAARVPQRPAVIHRGEHRTYGELLERSRRFAGFLNDQGLGLQRERVSLAGHEIGQDLVGQFLYNCPEYLEGLIGCYLGRLAPFNINYRYARDELRYLLRDAKPAALLYHATFAPILSEVLGDVGDISVLLQVADESGNSLLPGAIDYEQALASVPTQVERDPSPDDLYVLYTGGTTGMPKGVLWRQADAAVALVGLRDRRTGEEWSSIDDLLGAIRESPYRFMPTTPLMHGGAQWGALQTICDGNTLVLPDRVDRLDPADVWDTAAEHEVQSLSIIGDALARPLIEELEEQPRTLPRLRLLSSGGAALSEQYKTRLTTALPGLKILETIGSSETGVQGRALGTSAGARAGFVRESTALVVAEDRTKVLEPGDQEVGWLATRGRVPLGYLGDAPKTAETFCVINGERMSVPGDRARLLADGRVELLGRDSVTINTGGEKVFAEEVEAVLRAHPGVADAVVCGRRSARWGSEVVAIVQRSRSGDDAQEAAQLIGACAEHLARYKLPKDILFVDTIHRHPTGKPDYKWAAAQVNRPAPDGTH